MPTSRAISKVLSIVVVIAIILVAFLGYAVGATTQRASTYTASSTVTTTSYSLNSTTITVTKLVTYSASGQVLTLTEYVTDYDLQTDTEVLYSQSSTTYSCFVGTVSLGVTSSTSSFGLENATGVFTSVTVTTVYSLAGSGLTTTTITGSYPLTTYATTSDGSSITLTTCSAES